MFKSIKLMSILITTAVLFSFVIAGCGGSGNNAAPNADNKNEGGKKYNFVLITMDSMDQHWLSVKRGAEEKAQELGNVTITFRAPADKTDPGEQVRMVEDAINQKADAILLAPLDAEALKPVVEKAAAANIPVVNIDSPVNTDKIVSFIATDNIKAAQIAADTLAELIGKKGKIAIINHQPGAGTAMMRENGFKEEIKNKYPDIQIVTTQYSMGDKTKAMNQALDIMTANPDLAGFYACNEGSTVGVAQAIKQRNATGKIKLVGFDKSQDTINAIKEGMLQATMVQNPYKMGNLGVQFAYDTLQGKEVEKKVDTGVTVITKDNIEEIISGSLSK